MAKLNDYVNIFFLEPVKSVSIECSRMFATRMGYRCWSINPVYAHFFLVLAKFFFSRHAPNRRCVFSWNHFKYSTQQWWQTSFGRTYSNQLLLFSTFEMVSLLFVAMISWSETGMPYCLVLFIKIKYWITKAFFVQKFSRDAFNSMEIWKIHTIHIIYLRILYDPDTDNK